MDRNSRMDGRGYMTLNCKGDNGNEGNQQRDRNNYYDNDRHRRTEWNGRKSTKRVPVDEYHNYGSDEKRNRRGDFLFFD